MRLKIETAFTNALKTRNKSAKEALGAVKTAIVFAQAAKGVHNIITDDEVIKIVQKQVKQREESAKIYQEQNRPELAEIELEELKHLEILLPKQVSDEDLESIVIEKIAETGTTSIKDMGKVIGAVSKLFSAGEVDNSKISTIVKKQLGI